MSYQDCLTPGQIKSIFADEVTAGGGTVSSLFENATQVWVRAILRTTGEVRPQDPVNPGVALRATERDVWIHPYVFRQVCRNGAILAQTLQSEHIEDLNLQAPDEAADRIREAVRACCAGEVFAAATQQMRTASQTPADLAVNMMLMLDRLPSAIREQVVGQIMEQFAHAGDRSQFGLMNAVTAVARETRDPDLGWRLEELGGGMLARLRPVPVPDDAALALAAG